MSLPNNRAAFKCPHHSWIALMIAIPQVLAQDEANMEGWDVHRYGPDADPPLTLSSLGSKSRSRKSAQGDKWSFCLKAAMMAANRRDHEQTSPPESLTGLQGQGGACRHPGRPDTAPIGLAFRRPPQSGHRLESPT